MIRDIDFGTLTLIDAVDLAILIEEESRERYEEFVRQMELHHSGEASKFFLFMVEEERSHELALREKREALFGDAPSTIDRAQVWEIEAPKLHEARAFMSPRQALGVAMQAEHRAHDFFDLALHRVTDEGVRALFAELREEEVEHQKLIGRELAKLPEEADVDPNDYVDPPKGL